MSPSLLSTKLHFPQARPGLVRRPRLTGMLAQGTRGPLTLVSAPAGSGKTTLMGEWFVDGKTRSPVAWVALDPAENDPLRFLAYLTAAIEAVLPGLIRPTVDLLQSARPPDLEIITSSLTTSLNAITSDLIVALDDYHAITSLAVHDLLNDLLAHASPCLHLLILFVRSVLFFLACLPLLIAWQGSRLSIFWRLGLALFYLVGFQSLLIANWMPWSLRLPHMIEILFDEFVYAGTLTWLMVAGKSEQQIRHAAEGRSLVHA